MNFFRSASIHAFIVALVVLLTAAAHKVVKPAIYNEALFFPAKIVVPTVRPAIYHPTASATGGHASSMPQRLAVGASRAVTVRQEAQPVMVARLETPMITLPTSAERTVTEAPQPHAAGFGQQSAINGSNRVQSGVVSGGFGQGAGTGNGHGNGVVKLAAFSVAQEPVRAAVRALPDTSPAVVYSVPKAFYSQAARAANVTGAVVLKVRFSADGTVEVLDIVQSPGYGLDDVARQVATGIAFKPAVRDGQAVDSVHTVTIQFQLL
jgi:TonB family protein